MEALFNWLNGIIWSNALIALCLGAGLWFTLRTRVMQVRGFAEMCRLTVTMPSIWPINARSRILAKNR